jgi:chemotaxis protein methyltransferase CheR
MLSNTELKQIAQFICETTGIVYHEESYFQLEKRVTHFSTENNIEPSKFLSVLKNNKVLSSKFLETATNNETYFFRDPVVWSTFIDILFDKIALEKKESLNGLFVGCSRGQEIYSLEMLLNEKKDLLRNLKIHLTAYDFNSSVLTQAKEGQYTQLEISRGLDPARTKKYFNYVNTLLGSYTFKNEYRLPCEFKVFNLLSDKFPIAEYDFIICRNVLIYQTESAKKEILSEFYNSLRPHGVLLLGAAEKLLLPNIGHFNEKSINAINFYVK